MLLSSPFPFFDTLHFGVWHLFLLGGRSHKLEGRHAMKKMKKECNENEWYDRMSFVSFVVVGEKMRKKWIPFSCFTSSSLSRVSDKKERKKNGSKARKNHHEIIERIEPEARSVFVVTSSSFLSSPLFSFPLKSCFSPFDTFVHHLFPENVFPNGFTCLSVSDTWQFSCWIWIFPFSSIDCTFIL